MCKEATGFRTCGYSIWMTYGCVHDKQHEKEEVFLSNGMFQQGMMLFTIRSTDLNSCSHARGFTNLNHHISQQGGSHIQNKLVRMPSKQETHSFAQSARMQAGSCA
jgi:hypothetical protein